MPVPMIAGADIQGQRVVAYLEDDREVSLDFPLAIRRVTILDRGNRMVVETTDAKWISFSATQLAQRATATA